MFSIRIVFGIVVFNSIVLKGFKLFKSWCFCFVILGVIKSYFVGFFLIRV